MDHAEVVVDVYPSVEVASVGDRSRRRGGAAVHAALHLRLLVPSLRTEVTEIVTGLAMLGVGDVDWALAERPAAMANVDDAHWERLAAARHDPAHAADFVAGVGQRPRLPAGRPTACGGRPPRQVEWKGPDKLPAVADVPADLRIDHVYLVSCKYLSKILRNSSPAGLFDGCLGSGRPTPSRTGTRSPRRGSTRTSGRRSATTCPTPSSRTRSTPSTGPSADGARRGPAGEAEPPGRQGLPALRPRGGRPVRRPLAGRPARCARPRADAVAHAPPHRCALLRARLVRGHARCGCASTPRGTGASASA